MIDRRTFLKAAAASALSPLFSVEAVSAKSPRSPFALGVASGSPTDNGVVLWTRIFNDDTVSGGETKVPFKLKWEVALDEHFRKIEQQGEVATKPTFGHSVHLELTGLQPDRVYWYRFLFQDGWSPVGRTRTTALRNSPNKSVAFAFASCQRYETGYYTAYRDMIEQDLDFVLFLGDYIYERPVLGNDVVRAVNLAEARTLQQYRTLYEIYKSDLDLQNCHARFPWIVTWDDHEVSDDYANDRSNDLDSSFLSRRAAAYQAYYEHMPLPSSARPNGAGSRIYGSYDFGNLLKVHLLDTRQYRDYQVDPPPGRGGSNMVARSPQLAAEQRSMLGRQQEKFLDQSLKDSSSVWDLIAQQTLVAQNLSADNKVWTDGWDGYPAARRRLLQSIKRKPSANTLVVGGDVHSYVLSELKLDFDNPREDAIATEICGSSISSPGMKISSTTELYARNPHIKFFRSDVRGYVTMRLTEDVATIDLRAVKHIASPDSRCESIGTFAVKKGKAAFLS